MKKLGLLLLFCLTGCQVQYGASLGVKQPSIHPMQVQQNKVFGQSLDNLHARLQKLEKPKEEKRAVKKK